MRHERKDIPAELDGVVDRLLAHRAELSPIEMDRIKLDSRRRAAGPRHTTRETQTNMKTRTSILALLASGMLLSTGGAALGVSGLAGSDSAGNAQYQVTPAEQGGRDDEGVTVLGASETNTPDEVAAGESAGESASAPAVAQPSAQQSLEDSGDELPFTGYAAIPVLLLGLGLLGAGVMMRRRSARDMA